MSILDPQYNMQPLGYETDTRYFHLIFLGQEILKQVFIAQGMSETEAIIEAHRGMVDSRLAGLERARILNQDS